MVFYCFDFGGENTFASGTNAGKIRQFRNAKGGGIEKKSIKNVFLGRGRVTKGLMSCVKYAMRIKVDIFCFLHCVSGEKISLRVLFVHFFLFLTKKV